MHAGPPPTAGRRRYFLYNVMSNNHSVKQTMKSFAILFFGFAIALSAQPLNMTTPMHGDIVYQENFDKTTTLDGFTQINGGKWKIENGKLVHPIVGSVPQLLLP